jgi:hypothetical protein
MAVDTSTVLEQKEREARMVCASVTCQRPAIAQFTFQSHECRCDGNWYSMCRGHYEQIKQGGYVCHLCQQSFLVIAGSRGVA